MRDSSGRFDINTSPIQYAGRRGNFFTNHGRKIVYTLIGAAFLALGWYALDKHFKNKDLRREKSQLEQTVRECRGEWPAPKPMSVTELGPYKPKQKTQYRN